MKTTITYLAAGVAALALTVACSSKTKVTDEVQPVDTSTYQTVPETTTPPPSTATTTIPDETSKVASLGASSSGRSR